MFTYGKQANRIARSQFSRNFFASGGFEVIDNPGFKEIQGGIKVALKSKAEIVVICSPDEDYPKIAPDIIKALKDNAIVVIAGNPRLYLDDLRAAGIEHFVHSGSNVLESLEEFQKVLGIQ